MAFEEKRAWVMGLVTIVAYSIYVILVLTRGGDAPLTETPYVATLIWTIVAAILASIVLDMLVSGTTPEEERRKDQRDVEIGHFGDRIGQSFLAIGAVATMVLAMTEADHFWIANTIYLAFALTSVLTSVAKIAAYRWGFQ
ncbi:hypothetical protein KIPE111705_07625 [Kibdelosporangium persicum]|uniref:Uncharacterized protein n=1 Tax=Kibdelosporangium persicum TaxID=2698649 RepID=A0ABX2F1V7_9PSEU|nr:hypothetical protein [Kibdelosporangium persicum]NRN65290.1 hypothetical protein [Kibdelosporangium persicum]